MTVLSKFDWKLKKEYSSWLHFKEVAYCKQCKISLESSNDAVNEHMESNAHKILNASVKGMSVSLVEDTTVQKGLENKKSKALDNIKEKENYYRKHYAAYITIILEKFEHVAFCSACNETYINKKDVLSHHFLSHKHKVNTGINDDNFDYEKAKAEIKLAAYTAFKKQALLAQEESVKFIKYLLPDSKIAEKLSCERHHLNDIITHVIAPFHKKKLIEILNKVDFSITIDESTDRTVTSFICVVVRFADPETKQIVETLWDLIPLYDDNVRGKADAETIFQKVFLSFKEANVDFTHLIAFCSDGANVMMGDKNSVFKRFQNIVPNIMKAKCKCHIEHLVARDGTKTLPQEVLSLVSLVYNYISSSSSRKNRWSKKQISLNQKPLEILKPAGTRWLSHYDCIIRILRRWHALKKFFEEECTEFNLTQSELTDKTPEHILGLLTNREVQTVYVFLEFVLGRLTFLNKCLQSEAPVIPEDRDKMIEELVFFLKCYLNDSYVDDYVKNSKLSNINPTSESNYKLLDKMNVGDKTETFLETLNNNGNNVEELLVYFRSFYIEICQQIMGRLNVDDEQNVHVTYFNELNALDTTFHNKHPNLNEVFNSYKCIIDEKNVTLRDQINDEWKLLVQHNFSNDEKMLLERAQRTDKFWFTLKDFKVDNIHLFQNLASFALSVCSVPNSNAASERVWSLMNLIKTACRNRLTTIHLRGNMFVTYFIRDLGGIYEFEPTVAMVELMKKSVRQRKRRQTKPIDIQDESTDEIMARKDEEMFRKKFSGNIHDDQDSILNETSNFSGKRRKKTKLDKKHTNVIDIDYVESHAPYEANDLHIIDLTKTNHSDHDSNGLLLNDTVDSRDDSGNHKINNEALSSIFESSLHVQNEQLNDRHNHFEMLPLIKNGSNEIDYQFINGNRTRIFNTCAFDSLSEIFTSGYFIHKSMMEYVDRGRQCQYLSAIVAYLQSEFSLKTLYFHRANILKNFPTIQQHSTPNTMDCSITVGFLLEKMLEGNNEKLLVNREICSYCNLEIETARLNIFEIPYTWLNFFIEEGGLENLQLCITKLFDNPEVRVCDQCNQRKMKCYREAGKILLLETEWLFFRCERTLNSKFPNVLLLNDKVYNIVGVVEVTPGHFKAYVRVNGIWEKRDDMTQNIQYLEELPTNLKLSLLIYAES